MHVITVKRGLEGVVVPSKLYGILEAGKPILVVAPQETDAADIAERHLCGLSADPDKAKEMAAGVSRVSREPQTLQAMGLAARAAAADYDRANETRKFARVVEEAEDERRDR